MITSERVQCPYCGESFEALIDTTVEEQQYIEDCEICCRPITFLVEVDSEGRAQVVTRHEDDA